ncbi:SA1362 family protein [Alteribacillus sp. HJP-4]|uniref:SA1362 family protein n=1 Tax=Alteribacillus sp. HJP-4 TaxID=2775394 RepID=UPI0035CCF8D3
MSRLPANPFTLILFGLAVLGLGYQLTTDPLGLLTYLLVGAAVAVGIYFLFTRVILKRTMMNQYRTAARPKTSPRQQPPAKSAKLSKNTVQPKKHPSRAITKKRSDHNLTVIEGKKNRKKNRALF